MTCRWVPKTLNEHQKNERVTISRDLFSRFEREGPGFLERIITGDESWFHFYEPESKRQSQEWRGPGNLTRVKARAEKSAGKRMATAFLGYGWNTLKKSNGFLKDRQLIQSFT